MKDKRLHELEFPDGQAYGVLGRELKTVCLQDEVFKMQIPGCIVVAAPGQRADACHQFFHGKWLGQVIVRAGIKPVDPVIDFRFCRKEQNRRCDPVFPDFREDFKAVHFRHHDVEYDAVIAVFFYGFVCLHTVVDGVDIVTFVGQYCRYRTVQVMRVFCQQ